MPIIDRKTLDRVNRDDILLLDAGNLIKAGQQIGDNISILAGYNVPHVVVVSPTREECSRLDEVQRKEYIQKFIENYQKKQKAELRFSLKNTLMNFHEVFNEKDQLFSVPGKRNYLEENELLSRKLDSLNFNQVQAGSSRIIDKYKFKYTSDLMLRFQSFYDKLKPIESGMKEQPGVMKRFCPASIRMNSLYDGAKLTSIGDSLVNQSIDTALLFLHTFTNINKKRIIEGRPFSESRWDPSQKKSVQGIYQYKPELILEASLGILLHNIGYAHSSVHRIISGKPILSPSDDKDRRKIKLVQNSLFALKHLLDREDISSITRMICMLQKDYPDGTGFPAPNENRFLFEFVRLFQIIDFYDQMTNPVIMKTVFSRMDVIDYMISNSGEYNYSGEKFKPQPRFDSMLVREFLSVLAPFEINEKVYLYEKGKRNQPLFIGKVVSYPGSHIPMISLLRDDKNDRSYRDGTVFIHIPSSSLYLKAKGKTERKKYAWIENLEIFDKNVNAGSIEQHRDSFYGAKRPLKHSRR